MKIWRCSYASTRAGTLIVNTFHVVNRGTPPLAPDPGADEVRDTLNAALTTKYRACCTTDVTVNSLTVREELAPGDSSIPAESVASINLAGTRAPGDTKLPTGLCQLATIRTNAAVRSGHGRLWMPPAVDGASLAATHTFVAAGTYQLANKAFLDELQLHHDMGLLGVDGHLDTVIYSRTRRARGDADYFFDMTAYILRAEPHWLRSRQSAP